MSTFVNTKTTAFIMLFLSVLPGFNGCKITETKTLEVTATAYNTLPGQTNSAHPMVGAWGDTLYPGTKSIAVSRDLIELGLSHNTEVKIEGLPGKYIVLDKMNRRWEKRIDIHMDKNTEAALEWGVKKVTIKWETEK